MEPTFSEWSKCGFRVVVGPPCSISGIVGLVMVGPLYRCTDCCHDKTAAWAAFCRYNLPMELSESSRASRKAAEAVSTDVSSRAKRGCSGQEVSCCCAWNHVENQRFDCDEG